MSTNANSGCGVFDGHHPPSTDLVKDCVHCGFCLPTCPTYALWGEEMDSPRGRIVLMREGLEEGSELSDVMVTHLDRCLGCMACVTACPSGVRYDRLIEDARAQVERRHERSTSERGLRDAIFETFTHPGRLRALVPALAAARRLGLPKLARRGARLARACCRLRLARARRDGAPGRGRAGCAPAASADDGGLPRSVPPRARAGRSRAAATAPARHPGARPARAGGVGAVLRVGR